MHILLCWIRTCKFQLRRVDGLRWIFRLRIHRSWLSHLDGQLLLLFHHLYRYFWGASWAHVLGHIHIFHFYYVVPHLPSACKLGLGRWLPSIAWLSWPWWLWYRTYDSWNSWVDWNLYSRTKIRLLQIKGPWKVHFWVYKAVDSFIRSSSAKITEIVEDDV